MAAAGDLSFEDLTGSTPRIGCGSQSRGLCASEASSRRRCWLSEHPNSLLRASVLTSRQRLPGVLNLCPVHGTIPTRGLNLSQARRILVGNRKAPTVRVFGTDRTGAGITLFSDPRRGDGGTRSGAEEAAAGGGTRRRRAVRRFSRS